MPAIGSGPAQGLQAGLRLGIARRGVDQRGEAMRAETTRRKVIEARQVLDKGIAVYAKFVQNAPHPGPAVDAVTKEMRGGLEPLVKLISGIDPSVGNYYDQMMPAFFGSLKTKAEVAHLEAQAKFHETEQRISMGQGGQPMQQGAGGAPGEVPAAVPPPMPEAEPGAAPGAMPAPMPGPAPEMAGAVPGAMPGAPPMGASANAAPAPMDPNVPQMYGDPAQQAGLQPEAGMIPPEAGGDQLVQQPDMSQQPDPTPQQMAQLDARIQEEIQPKEGDARLRNQAEIDAFRADAYGLNDGPYKQEEQKKKGAAAVESMVKAKDAINSLPELGRLRNLLEDGIIAGESAELRLTAWKKAWLVGGEGALTEEQKQKVIRTEDYKSGIITFATKLLQEFGAGTGLSDADFLNALKASAGDINVETESMIRVLQNLEKSKLRLAHQHNKDWPRSQIKGLPKQVTEELAAPIRVSAGAVKAARKEFNDNPEKYGDDPAGMAARASLYTSLAESQIGGTPKRMKAGTIKTYKGKDYRFNGGPMGRGDNWEPVE